MIVLLCLILGIASIAALVMTKGTFIMYMFRKIPGRLSYFLLILHLMGSVFIGLFLPNNVLVEYDFFSNLFKKNEWWIPAAMIACTIVVLIIAGYVITGVCLLIPEQKEDNRQMPVEPLHNSKWLLRQISPSFARMEKTVHLSLKRLFLIGHIEGISYLVLLGIAMPLKYMYNMPEWVRIVGMAHGILFVLFVFALINVRMDTKLPLAKLLAGFVASLIPFATFFLPRIMGANQK